MVGGENQSSALLIAPTTSLVANVASRIAQLALQPYTTKSSVVHGDNDALFCPNQGRWNNIPGVELQILADNHIFLRSSSLRVLTQILFSHTNDGRWQ